MFYTIWYHLYNFKNVKNTHGRNNVRNNQVMKITISILNFVQKTLSKALAEKL